MYSDEQKSTLLNGNHVQKPLQSALLRNWLITGAMRIDDTIVRIKNTCGFDALCQIFSDAFMYSVALRDEVAGIILASNNLFMRTVKSLATLLGATEETYRWGSIRS